MGNVIRGYAVVVAEIPLTFELYDGVVGGPTYDGVEDDTFIGKWSIGIVANSIAKQVAVTCRVGEIILSIVFVHPRGLEEAVWITGL
jgi:hypothetical protein